MIRALPAMLLCLCLMFAGLPATLAQEGEAGTQEIMQRLEELSKKIDTLEKNLMQRMNALDSKIAAIPATAGAPQKHPLEGEAQNEFGKIRQLVSAAKMEEAKGQMTTFLEKYGDTNVAKQARQLHQELSVVGKEAPAEWGIEFWADFLGNLVPALQAGSAQDGSAVCVSEGSRPAGGRPYQDHQKLQQRDR